MTTNDVLRVPDSVATRRIGDETILLNLTTGTYFGLDIVGSRFLELLEQDGQLAVVLSAMLKEFEVEPKTLEGDILRLGEEMRSKGLLETVS